MGSFCNKIWISCTLLYYKDLQLSLIAVKGLHVFNEVHIVSVQNKKMKKLQNWKFNIYDNKDKCIRGKEAELIII